MESPANFKTALLPGKPAVGDQIVGYDKD